MTTPRNLWPLGIIVALAVFITGTVGLIVMACSQRVDLVSPDYYERELKFQGQIDRVERTHHAASQASVAYDAAGKCITVLLPPDQAGREIIGRIELYRPSAAGLDRAVKLDPDAKGIQRLDASGLEPGLWRVRVSWTSEKQNYYLEQQVVVGQRTS
jgi:hypothetical protein